jgi:steroid delta-isomerase
MDNEQKIAAVNKYMDAFSGADMNLIREIYADDAVVEDPVGS